jgi:hypothetical protein
MLRQSNSGCDDRAGLIGRFEDVRVHSDPFRAFDVSRTIVEEKRARRLARQDLKTRTVDRLVGLGPPVLT